jgi:zinc transport system substrate-binding protein
LTIVLNYLRIVLMKALVAALLPLALTGCAAFTDDTASTDDGIQVAAAFYPLQYVAERVAGDHATVTNLTAPGGEPHDLELTPQETAEVTRADLVVYLPGFQPTVDDAVDTIATGDVLDVSDAVDLRDGNPHFWQDPLLMADLGDEVADRLTEIDPAHADDYAAEAGALRSDLEALDASYAAGLADCERHTVVVSHDAFGYLDRYGLEFEPIEGLSPGAEPTPADLARLQDLIRDDGITTVFSEALVSPEAAEQLARDTGVTSAVLDPLEGLTDETSDEDYLSLMKANLAALEEANGG